MQPFSVANPANFADTQVSKRDKLIEKLRDKPNNFTWEEGVRLMRLCGFRLLNRPGSARMFVHEATGTKVRLHEPHPQRTLKPYMMEQMLEGLRAAGEIE